jgi:ABC-2 type transport system permease protein
MTTAIDLTPAPGAAPASRRVVRHALTEARLLVRNGEQLLLALVIPVGVLLAGPLLGGRLSGGLDVLAPSVLALAVWSSAFTSVAIATGFERRYGVLERLAATPLGRSGLLAGKAGAVLLILAGQLAVLAAVALVLGWRPAFTTVSALAAVALVILAGAAFVSLALLLAGRLRAEVTLAVANLVYILLLAGGALIVPLDRYPAALQPVLALLPTAALGEGLRAAATGQVLLPALAVLLVWLLVAAALTRRLFRWT